MKRIIALTTVALIVASMLCACHGNEVYLEPMDYRFTPAHTEIETDIEHVYIGDTWVSIPVSHSVFYSDEYEILYRITYEDGAVEDHWKTVGKREYDSFVNENK